MKAGNRVIEVTQLIKGYGYELVTTDKDYPIVRFHQTKENFESLGNTPATLEGATVDVCAWDESAKTLFVVFRRIDGTFVLWELKDIPSHQINRNIHANQRTGVVIDYGTCSLVYGQRNRRSLKKHSRQPKNRCRN